MVHLLHRLYGVDAPALRTDLNFSAIFAYGLEQFVLKFFDKIFKVVLDDRARVVKNDVFDQ